MIVGEYFDIRELVPKSIFKVYGYNSIMFINNSTIEMAYNIRSHFNKPMLVNNWHLGGDLKYRGYRPAFTRIGSKNSQHKLGNAIDFNIKGVSSDEVNFEIERNWKSLGVSALEDKDYTKTWTHVDCRNLVNKDNLKIVAPRFSILTAFKNKYL